MRLAGIPFPAIRCPEKVPENPGINLFISWEQE